MSYDKCHIRFHFYLLHTLKKHTHHPQILSHGDDANNLNTNHNNLGFRVSSRSTTLSLSSSSSNTYSNHSMFSNNTRTLEEVWKDINLSATNHRAAGVNGYRGFILQDFLGKPFSNNDTHTTGSPSSPPPPPPQPPMLLTLNSGPEDPTRNVCPPLDRRHKRMIKNRESAARSRARKQAYTNELENEVERLKVENTELKRQHKQLQLATTAQMKKKEGLQRTSTAPF